MGKKTCCVGPCANKSWLPDQTQTRGHVKELKFHSFPKKAEERALWVKQVSKGRSNFEATKSSYVCSNHFQNGKPTFDKPYPTLFLSPSDFSTKKSPKKRRLIKKARLEIEDQDEASVAAPQSAEASELNEEEAMVAKISPSFSFEQLTRESDVRFYTGFETTLVFKTVFEHLLPTAKEMQYWKGDKLTRRDDPEQMVDFEEHVRGSSLKRKRRGPSRKLSLEREFLLAMMRLRVGLLIEDLAFRFDISTGLVTEIFFTWVRLMSLEFGGLIIWADRENVRRNLPDSFRKYYPKCRVIIDCTEVFIETPSSLDLAALCWSQYKHHYTLKFLVGITPNGAISFLSNCYGGRASDIFITEDCGFAKKLLPGDQVMADRGFKIRELLAYYQCFLTIPPSTVGSSQMSKADVAKTSLIANVRIFVEKAIRRIKEYRVLKNEIPILLLPLMDDIVTVCAAFTNLKRPLNEQ